MSRGSLGYASLSGSSQSARLLRLQTATHVPVPYLPRGGRTHARNLGVIASATATWRLPVGHSPDQVCESLHKREATTGQSATANHFPTFTARAATRCTGNPQAKAGLAAGGLYHPCSAGLPRHQSLTAADLGRIFKQLSSLSEIFNLLKISERETSVFCSSLNPKGRIIRICKCRLDRHQIRFCLRNASLQADADTSRSISACRTCR